MRFRRGAVIGGGTMGAGIAYVLAASGTHVHLVEPDDRAYGRAQELLTRRGPEHLPKLVRSGSVADLPDGLDVIIEAVPEDLAVKREVLAQAQSRHPKLLGSNTSSIAISELASPLPDPSALVGLHFFNPVWVMPLLEVVRSPHTRRDVLAEARALAAQLDKQAIVVADRPGFATSRLGVLLGLEAMRMLEEGVASAEDLDAAMVLGYRHPVGPLRLSDLVGLDVRLDIARNLHRAYGDRYAPPRILRDKVARGELGRKTGQGFFSWDEPDSP